MEPSTSSSAWTCSTNRCLPTNSKPRKPSQPWPPTAYRQIIAENDGKHPTELSPDMGREFTAEFAQYLRANDTQHRVKDPQQPNSIAVVDRGIRTLKTILANWMPQERDIGITKGMERIRETDSNLMKWVKRQATADKPLKPRPPDPQKAAEVRRDECVGWWCPDEKDLADPHAIGEIFKGADGGPNGCTAGELAEAGP